jgi:hypothetical protein
MFLIGKRFACAWEKFANIKNANEIPWESFSNNSLDDLFSLASIYESFVISNLFLHFPSLVICWNVNFDGWYLGMLYFCLTNSLSLLSAPSRLVPLDVNLHTSPINKMSAFLHSWNNGAIKGGWRKKQNNNKSWWNENANWFVDEKKAKYSKSRRRKIECFLSFILSLSNENSLKMIIIFQ